MINWFSAWMALARSLARWAVLLPWLFAAEGTVRSSRPSRLGRNLGVGGQGRLPEPWFRFRPHTVRSKRKEYR